MLVEKIESWVCDVPLSDPINLGKFIITQRQYLAVRLHTSDGFVADCISLSRGAPLDVIVADVITPRVLGKDARDIAHLRSEFAREMTALGTYGAVCRAWSAVEICLQDLRAQACGWPLWRLLGGAPRTVPVSIVEGYAIGGESDDDFVNRLVGRVEQGFELLKIEAGHYTDDALMLRQLEEFRSQVGDKPEVVLDMAWVWSESKSRMKTLQKLEDLGIAWIEDPFGSDCVNKYQNLCRASNLAIGGGDETSKIENMYALLDANALDVIRLDATTMGGIEAVRALSVDASRRGVRVAYHVHPEIHEHLVFGLGIADHVEMFPTDRQFDRTFDLLTNPNYNRVVDGHLAPNETPGTGLKLDNQKMEPFVRRHFSSS